LTRLMQVTESVNKALDGFRFHEAVHSLYEFVWSEFCDWYIEAAKQAFSDEKLKKDTLQVFDYTLFAILKLLHPFMPFVTEEVAHQLGYLEADESITEAEYPDSAKIAEFIKADNELLNGMDAKFAIIRAARNMRANYNIPPSKKIEAYFRPADDKTAAFLQKETDSIKFLMRAESFTVDADYEAEKGTPSTVTDAGTFFIPLAGLIDIEAERAKLAKQKKELEDWIKGSRGKLSNENFVKKAPANVVEESRAKLAEMEEKLARVEEMLSAL